MPSSTSGYSERGDAWVCQTCYQPECKESRGGTRPNIPNAPRLEDGKRDYRGYGEWAVHPNEATFLLHRGYAIVEGQQRRVRWIHNEAFVTQIKVDGTFPEERSADTFTDASLTRAA